MFGRDTVGSKLRTRHGCQGATKKNPLRPRSKIKQSIFNLFKRNIERDLALSELVFFEFKTPENSKTQKQQNTLKTAVKLWRTP